MYLIFFLIIKFCLVVVNININIGTFTFINMPMWSYNKCSIESLLITNERNIYLCLLILNIK